eukprot:5829922-Lingulodinium_polyedra.AAC.1
MFGDQFKRLEVNIPEKHFFSPLSPSALEVWAVLRKDILSLPESQMLEGIAPPGDLERRAQAWIDAGASGAVPSLLTQSVLGTVVSANSGA